MGRIEIYGPGVNKKYLIDPFLRLVGGLTDVEKEATGVDTSQECTNVIFRAHNCIAVKWIELPGGEMRSFVIGMNSGDGKSCQWLAGTSNEFRRQGDCRELSTRLSGFCDACNECNLRQVVCLTNHGFVPSMMEELGFANFRKIYTYFGEMRGIKIRRGI